MRVLLTGASGMLGTDVARELARDDVRAPSHAEADLAEEGALEQALGEFRPELILHCAAYTDVDGCELNPTQAERGNVLATRNVAALAAKTGSRLVHVSTDYVFDGAARRPYPVDAPVNPLSVYGRTKLAAEREVEASGAAFLIVRTAWLVGAHGKNFVEAIRVRARQGADLEVVDDQRGTPTFTRDLAPALVALARTRHTGVLHVTNQGECTRYEQARAIVELEGFDARVAPVSSDKHPRPARRPSYSVLDNSAANAILGRPLPPWRESLARYLKETGGAA
jgi:dTDP-4-dehydrorhamnose reductase